MASPKSYSLMRPFKQVLKKYPTTRCLVYPSHPVRFYSSNQDEGSSEVMEMKQIKRQLRSLAGVSKYWSGETTKLDIPTLELVERQDQLPAKRMTDSNQVVVLPFGSDKILRQKYLNFYLGLRLGKILGDLDCLAAWISYLHIHGGRENLTIPSPYTVVTAMIDHIDLYQKKIVPDHDIKMSGNVTWVGSSSMEVSMKLCQNLDGAYEDILDARFLMVSRDIVKNSKAIVNPLLLETNEEKKNFKRGEENCARRKKTANTGLTKSPPTAQESELIHELMPLKTSLFDTSVKKAQNKMDDNSVLMEDTKLSSVFVCNPQERNFHNKVFGGFCLEKAFALSWTTACLFSGSRPIFKSMDDIWFRKSVDIGSIMEFTSHVVYTPSQPTKRFQIMTVADVIKPNTGERVNTNIFYYTFESEFIVRSVAPKSYEEAMRFLEGKRKYEKNNPTQ